jgi:hypothetical protein
MAALLIVAVATGALKLSSEQEALEVIVSGQWGDELGDDEVARCVVRKVFLRELYIDAHLGTSIPAGLKSWRDLLPMSPREVRLQERPTDMKPMALTFRFWRDAQFTQPVQSEDFESCIPQIDSLNKLTLPLKVRSTRQLALLSGGGRTPFGETTWGNTLFARQSFSTVGRHMHPFTRGRNACSVGSRVSRN